MTSISKTQVDQLGVRLRKGEVSDDDLHRLDAYRGSFAEAYEEVVATIRSATGLDPAGRRAKSTPSIIEKLWRETIRLSQMQDIAGCRVVVEDIPKQNQAIERLTRAFAKADVIDRRERPSYGYRAVHVIATVRDKPVEIQVRTELQHLWAQQSEVLADRHDPRIKYGGGDPKLQQMLSEISVSIAGLEAVEMKRGLIEPALLEHLESDQEIVFLDARGHPLEDLRRQFKKEAQEFAERKAWLLRNLRSLNKIFAELPRRVN